MSGHALFAVAPPHSLITGQYHKIRLDLVQCQLEPLECVTIGSHSLTFLSTTGIDVSAFAGANAEMQIGNLKNRKVALLVEA